MRDFTFKQGLVSYSIWLEMFQLRFAFVWFRGPFYKNNLQAVQSNLQVLQGARMPFVLISKICKKVEIISLANHSLHVANVVKQTPSSC